MDRPNDNRPAQGDDWVRLGFHIVVTSREGEDCQQRCRGMLQQLLALFWPAGDLYDFFTSPYPKLPDAAMLRVAFDLPAPFEPGITGILHTVGGSGWHIDPEYDGEEGAVWMAEGGGERPFGAHFHWGEVRLIPAAHLAACRKPERPRATQ